MGEIVNVLREAAAERRAKKQPRCGDVFDGAADEITRLEVKLDRLTEAQRKLELQAFSAGYEHGLGRATLGEGATPEYVVESYKNWKGDDD